MKLRNKKTGEIGYLVVGKGCDHYVVTNDGWDNCGKYNSLAELNKEWEDAPEEPKVGYIIDPMEEDCVSEDDSGYVEPDVERAKELGIWFETKEEAEKAVEKLKAWKRLKDKGFRFDGYTEDFADLFLSQVIRCRFDDFGRESKKDRDLLFGGEV